MRALAGEAPEDVRTYLVGGTTAVLLGWRASTMDVDLVMHPEPDAVLRAIPALKERLHLNVELASPGHFIPVPDGWEERSRFICTIGRMTFLHYDLYAQALAKVERGHVRDLADVHAMLDRGLVTTEKAREYFRRIEPALYRFPAIDPPTF
ncbi:MAG: DUF6036 family nucleotidyltransferase, partial [Gemmatimonadaceae bacterium]